MDINDIKAIIEGLIFAAGGDEGIHKRDIRKVLDLDKEMANHLLEELKFEYEHTKRGIMLMESQQVLFLTTKPEHSEYFSKFKEAKVHTKLSQAALETLAIIAYLQPITRVEIEQIRGVKSERPLQTLISRALIEEVGRKEGVGRPILFGTTIEFLTYFGLSSIEGLPPLPEDIHAIDVEEEADLFFDRLQDLNN
ncbi:segregation and condensation protein B [Gracilibacillus boraciitolerans JCM 21714]|uniref:Segregation and condensation protein B n=1 Tax=Gracilibacillus boraciitolerans JCM 21714 TaxID=1298598 RepID=W4VES5_9BACI|nr:SMC-Scp complex subunit ScpB [Gracilibacillus boraciitolerans]GAE91313.1 segregation and condensation protein B [Gracilibacillus boraciitolerans JCM 21714]